MARHKNEEWNLSDPPPTWEQVGIAVLMDIRDELKALNRLLNCPNFIVMPHDMRAMRVAIGEMAMDARRRTRQVKARAAAKRTMRKVA